MILSVHMPKTGGETFGQALAEAFGPRMLRDYGDRAGFDAPHIRRARLERNLAARARRDALERDYDVIHGHFVADRYRGLFQPEHYVAFFRNPFQQAVSHFRYLQRSPRRADPLIAGLQGRDVTFVDYLRRESVINAQSDLMGAVPLDDFAVVALTEDFERGVALFNATFGCVLAIGDRVNVDPATGGAPHPLTPWERRAVREHRAADVELYARARERFEHLCALRGFEPAMPVRLAAVEGAAVSAGALVLCPLLHGRRSGGPPVARVSLRTGGPQSR